MALYCSFEDPKTKEICGKEIPRGEETLFGFDTHCLPHARQRVQPKLDQSKEPVKKLLEVFSGTTLEGDLAYILNRQFRGIDIMIDKKHQIWPAVGLARNLKAFAEGRVAEWVLLNFITPFLSRIDKEDTKVKAERLVSNLRERIEAYKNAKEILDAPQGRQGDTLKNARAALLSNSQSAQHLAFQLTKSLRPVIQAVGVKDEVTASALERFSKIEAPIQVEVKSDEEFVMEEGQKEGAQESES